MFNRTNDSFNRISDDEAAGSSVDYAYLKQDVKIAYALELRDTGRNGFFLPKDQILPTCEETFDGLMAAIEAIDQ
ncbi:carboxypeptidase A1 [Trichonephila clavata]|uniref:Carboxypeptidase A1 n=1 Tax=Trichonephila clavata TaxID=2740835 RepID=A0A8X6K806_TRICU|nr:carboxypeptidase A1 [Trichonephila clavata]